jgi:hypothetical protein
VRLHHALDITIPEVLTFELKKLPKFGVGDDPAPVVGLL